MGEQVLDPRDRQARVVGVAGFEGAPPGDPGGEGDRSIPQLDARKREMRPEGSPVESRKPQAQRPVARGGMAPLVQLPPRHRALEDPGDLLRAGDRDGREQSGLVLEHGPVSDRDIREGSGALEADHPRPEPSHGKGDLLQLLAGERGVGAPRRGRRGRRLRDGIRGPGKRATGRDRAQGAHGAPNEFAAGDESTGHGRASPGQVRGCFGPRRGGANPTRGGRGTGVSRGHYRRFESGSQA